MRKITCLFIAVLLLATACTSNKKSNTADSSSEKPVITVTIEPIRHLTQIVAGDRFKVICIVPAGHSPETYDPAPHQLVELAKSTLYFSTGYIGFEQVWMHRLAQNTPTVKFVNLSEGIPLMKNIAHSHQESEECNRHNTEEIEPHVWNAPSNVRIIADNMLSALCQIDPDGADYFRHRHDSLYNIINHTDSVIRDLLARPDAQHAFMIYHPALTYFAREYGLKQIAIEHEGKHPTPAQLQKLVEQCRQDSVQVIFIQPEFDRHNAHLVAQETQTKIVPINPLSYYWSEELIRTARHLVPSTHQFEVEF